MATRAVCRTLGSDERPRETQRPRLIIGYVLLAACALAAHSARCLVVIGQPGLATTCAGQSTQFQRHFACSLSSVKRQQTPARKRKQAFPRWEQTQERAEAWRPPLFRPSPSSEKPRELDRKSSLEPSRKHLATKRVETPILPSLAADSFVESKVNLYALSGEELHLLVTGDLDQPGRQTAKLSKLLYDKGVVDVTGLKGLPAAMRQTMAKMATIGAAWEVLARRESRDGTVKIAYGLSGGLAIESVLMPYGDGRRTACISTQVGCAQGCVFCATGQMGFKRHLSAGEIFEQAARYAAELRQRGERLSQVVLLGMGEPLANYRNTIEAVRRINKLLGIGMRHITISTVGLVPEIRRLADEGLQVTLAISLHAATDAERSALLPVNRRYQIADLLEAVQYYRKRTKRRVTFEWTLIAGENDDEETAQRLGRLLQAVPGSHVNLIPLNPTDGYDGGPTGRRAAARFVSVLSQHGIEATVRVRRGIDIQAGCGQLAERAVAEYMGASAAPPEAAELPD